ncbi:MAG: GWxTD domain-containing protein [Candidatus Aminicenantes bacterium]|jgi:GWxTD domain-containing protein
MKKKLLLLLIILTAAFFNPGDFLPAKDQKSREIKKKDLDKRYRDWLDLTHYIITDTEKEIFFKLRNNADREAFINLFWNLRDPSKGTPKNEYKEEHIKRFNYANRYFRYGTPLPGWKTDRGKIYIILGPPVSRNEISMQNFFYPIEIWEYYGNPQKGLPTVFRMVFYKRYGSGDFKLYIPAVDGPASLLRQEVGEIDPNNYAQVYNKIADHDPAVAEIALSLVPGEPTFGYSPSLQGPILVSKVFDSPKRNININYSRDFLKYKGYVQTSVTTDYINVTSDLYMLKEPVLGLNFVHLAILPERISVDYSPDRDEYYFNFDLMVVVKKGEDTIFQYTKKFPFYYTKAELDKKISSGVIITDFFPIIEGKYLVIAILQNSTNNEISYVEREIESTRVRESQPKLYGPLLSYQKIIRSQYSSYYPFNIIGYNPKIDPKRIFGLQDLISTLVYVEKGNYNKSFQVELLVESLDESREYLKKYVFAYPQGNDYWYFTQDLEKLHYGNYWLKAKILGETGIVLDVKEKDFQVSPRAYVPHPPLAAKKFAIENQFVFYFQLATQYEALKQYSRAENFYQQALRQNSTFPNLIKSYASFLFNQKKYDKILPVIENLKGQEKEAFSYYSFKGRALFYNKQYNAAVDALLKANEIYDSDIAVLNTLGYALIRIGEKKEAIKALSASLEIDKNQENILKVLKQIKDKKNTP